jgi:LPXTG-motif cell wall-anchored protein
MASLKQHLPLPAWPSRSRFTAIAMVPKQPGGLLELVTSSQAKWLAAAGAGLLAMAAGLLLARRAR